MRNIPIRGDTRQVSHLAVRLETPPPSPAPQPQARRIAVLYLHGFGSRQTGTKAEFFRRRIVDAGLACCSFDFQGHGESGGSMFDLSLTRNLADVRCAHRHLLELGYESIVLMGSSMGGGTALWYAAQHPEGVAAAIHIAPSVSLEEGLLRLVGPEKARQWEQVGKLFFEHEQKSCDISWQLIEDLRSYRIERLQSTYRTPTLILQGKNDSSVPWRKVTDFVVSCTFEEIELHLMADADHRMIDRLDHLWRLMHTFLINRRLVTDPSGERVPV